MALFGLSRRTVEEMVAVEKRRTNQLVSLFLGTMNRNSLNRKVKVNKLPFQGVWTTFLADLHSRPKNKRTVTVRDLLNHIDL